MKQHHKVGNRPGRPAYRTSSAYRLIKITKIRNSSVKKKLPAANSGCA